MLKLSCLVTAIAMLASCVVEDPDSEGEPLPDVSDERGPDRRPADDDDEQVPASCDIADRYGRVEPAAEETAFVGETESGDDYLFVETTISAGGSEHLVAVDLWNGYGVFEDGWTEGRYQISGEEADFDRCGACVYVLEDWDASDNTYGRLLMAEGGWLELEAVEPTPGEGRLTGTLDSASFREVNETSNGYFEVEQGCTTGIDEYTFDAPVESVDDYSN